ncbi:MAG: hypothetical protein ACREC1_00930 [Methylovirgula sp.]
MRSSPLPLVSATIGVLGVGLLCTSARADEAACKSIADAMMANTKTPYHSVGTISADMSGGATNASNPPKSSHAETIFTGTDIFVKLPSGQWRNVRAPLDEVRARVRASAASFTDCQRLADETADGKSLAVYTGTAKTPNVTVTTKVWIAPDRGVLMRAETDMKGVPQPDGQIRHQHLTMSYDYNDIKAPVVAQ